MLTFPFIAAQFVDSDREVDIRGATTMSFSKFETRVSEIATSVQRRFGSRVDATPIGSSFRASDPRHLETRDQFLADVFESTGSSHRCSFQSGGETFHCEIRGLKLSGPFSIELNSGDSTLGISARLYYEVQAVAHRFANPERTWGEWKDGVPNNLSRLELACQGLQWSVDQHQAGLIPQDQSD
ncbi:MAG: hypothetical protein AAF357_13170 [Verrucomicrobiota bacterium]